MVDCSLVNHKGAVFFFSLPEASAPTGCHTVCRIKLMAMILWRRGVYNINASLLMNTKCMPRLYNPRRLLKDYPIRYNIPHVLEQSYKPDVLRTTPERLTANRYGRFADVGVLAGLRVKNRLSVHVIIRVNL